MNVHPVGGFGVEVGTPPPPQGPGVAPPFAAPPTDRSRRGLWIGLGVGGLVALLCCIGGVFGVGLLYAGTTDQAKKQATAEVGVYLDSLRSGDIARAHALLCARRAAQISVNDLAEQARFRGITDFTLAPARFSATGVEVPAHLVTARGEVDETYVLDTEGNELRICDIR